MTRSAPTPAHSRIALAVSLLIAALGLSGCGSSANKVSVNNSFDVPTNDEYVALLHKTASREMAGASRRGGYQAADLIGRKPWFYKEYVEYPDGPDGIDILLVESESRATPLTAEVGIAKIRYSTEPTKKRQLARRDNNFLRNTGRETISYVLRGGKWHRVASLYVAETHEVLSNGVWVPSSVQPRKVEDTQVPGGIFRRTLRTFKLGDGKGKNS